MTRRPDRPHPHRTQGSSAWSLPGLPLLVASSPEALPWVVPHLVGFAPEHSLVVLGLAPGSNRAVVTLRFDIPSDDLLDEEILDVLDVWIRSFDAIRAAGADATCVVIYPAHAGARWADEIGDELPYPDLADVVEEVLVTGGLAVRDVVCVVGERVRSYFCDDRRCCPLDGRVLAPSEALRIQASLVEQGSAPLPNRRALVEALEPRADDDPVLLEVARARDGVFVRQPPGDRERVESFLHDVARWGARPTSTSTVTQLAVVAGLLVSEIRPRDYLLRELTVECDRRTLEAARSVLTEAVRCSRGSEAAPPAAVLGVCAWMAGDGAAARVAIDRALVADPAYSLAHLVRVALDEGMAPWSWQESMRSLTPEAILGDDSPGWERAPA